MKDNNTSSLMLLDHWYAFGFVAVAFWSEEEALPRREHPWPFLAPPWIHPWADMAETP